MSKVEQRMDAGMDAREDDVRAAKARRNAWLLAGVALFVYVGYVAWMFIRANGG